MRANPQNFSQPLRIIQTKPTSAVTASTLPLSELARAVACRVHSKLLLSLPACSLSCLALYHHTAAARGTK